ncbi:hypothetical protein F070042J6_16100 [Bacteroides sp. f07]|uniref:EpsG family protein n=1 Tax=Bacteroides sp. f07 TaxID=3132704 RepID=UPI0034B065D7
MIYYLLLLWLLILVFIEQRYSNQRSGNKLLFAGTLPIFLILALRSETVGTDTMPYLHMFEMVDLENYTSYFDDTLDYEHGFYLLQIIIKLFTNDSRYLIYATSLFTCVSMFYFIARNATNKVVLLYFFTTMGFFQFSLSGMRQTIAICITMFAYEFVKKKKTLYFLLLIVLAAQFHKSVVLAIPLYIIGNMNMTPKKAGVLFMGLLVIVLLGDKMLLWAADVMEYDKYTNIEKADNGYIFFSIVAIITYYAYKYRDEIQKQKETNVGSVNISFMSLSVWTARLISRTAERVSFYFMPHTYLVLEELLTQNTRNKSIVLIIVLSMMGYIFIHRLDDSFNYEFFF